MPTSAPTISAEFAKATVDWPRRARLLVAVSGGRDSVALLDLLCEAGFRKLVVCHLDHGLRARSSPADYRFVKKLADRLSLPFLGGRVETRVHARQTKQSLEAAARDLRYRFFAHAAKELRCHRIALAHHADDQIETCLLNLLRGAGSAGLGGMEAQSTRKVERVSLTLLRPLLSISRARIDAYIQSRNLQYREDLSNSSLDHTRNAIRHQVIPSLNQASGRHWQPALLRTAEILREENLYLEHLVMQIPVAVDWNWKELAAIPTALRRRLILRWLRTQNIPEPGFAEVQAVNSMLAPDGPAKINLPGGRHMRRRAGKLFIE